MGDQIGRDISRPYKNTLADKISSGQDTACPLVKQGGVNLSPLPACIPLNIRT